jgi:hypothetical protein
MDSNGFYSGRVITNYWTYTKGILNIDGIWIGILNDCTGVLVIPIAPNLGRKTKVAIKESII